MAETRSLLTAALADLWRMHHSLTEHRMACQAAGVPEDPSVGVMRQLLTAALLRRLEICELERLDG